MRSDEFARNRRRMAPTIVTGLRISPTAKMAMSLVVARISSMARNGALGFVGIYVDDDDFGTLVLHLADHGVVALIGKPTWLKTVRATCVLSRRFWRMTNCSRSSVRTATAMPCMG